MLKVTRRREKHVEKYLKKNEGASSAALNSIFYVGAPGSSIFQEKGPHIKNFRVGSETGDVRFVSLCLCALLLLISCGFVVRCLSAFGFGGSCFCFLGHMPWCGFRTALN